MASNTIQLRPLGRQEMAQLVAKAKEIGVAPEDYARQLVADGLALQRQAERMSFSQIMRPVRAASGVMRDAEIVKLVERARADYHRRDRRGSKSNKR